MKSVGSGVLEGDEHLNNYVLKVFLQKKMHSLKMVDVFTAFAPYLQKCINIF